MTGRTTGRPSVSPNEPADPFEFDYADRVDVYLRRAQVAESAAEKNFHVRHARQLLAACTDA